AVESLRWSRFRELFTSSERDAIRTLLPPVGILLLMAYANDVAFAGDFRGEILPEDEGRGGAAARQWDVREMTARLTEAFHGLDSDRPMIRDSDDAERCDGDDSRRKREYLRERRFAAYVHNYML